ncbi:MAG: ectoine/hydroxyectoine ABC transporter substrate-binding protein EhuB [Dongiaceae bacterium]
MLICSRRYLHFAILAVASLAVTAASAMAETTLERGLREGKLRIGFNSEKPYAYVDESGKATGFAIENARAILKKIGINEIEAIDMAWDSLIPALQANQIDLIASGMAVRPKRCPLVTFDNPSVGIGSAMMVKAGNPKNIHGYGDAVKSADARVGVIQGAEEGNWLKSVGMPESRIVNFPDPAAMLAGLKADRIDAFALAPVSIQAMLTELGPDGGLERALPFEDLVIDGQLMKFYQGEVFRKEDTDLRDAFNKVLVDFLGSPEQAALFAPFGITSAENPPSPPKTVEELCAGK